MARTVLFFNPQVAAFINQNFVPLWQSVRDVPTVTIEFGGGKAVKRTLNGNVATYICTSDGDLLDVLPGLYEPESYMDRLSQLKMLHNYTSIHDDLKRRQLLGKYHRIQYQRLRSGESPARFLALKDGSLKLSLESRDPRREWTEKLAGYRDYALPEKDLASWRSLMDDVRFNETEMRQKIHWHLATLPSESQTTPAKLTKWLYREVLHADIDDPYLGLGSVLDGSYPFARGRLN